MHALRLVFLALLACAAAHAQTPPEDGDRYSIVIVDQSPGSPAGDRLAAMLDAPPLREIASQCHRLTLRTDSPLYRERYAAALPPSALPVLALVRPDGGVIYKASGSAIPAAQALAAELTHRAKVDQSSADRADATQLVGLPSRPFLRPLDRVIPDSITVTPTLSVDGAVPAAIILVIGLSAFVLFAVVAAGAVAVIIYLRR